MHTWRDTPHSGPCTAPERLLSWLEAPGRPLPPTPFTLAHIGTRMPQSWHDGDARTTPVEPDRCVWCKHETSQSDSVPLGDAERICEECVGDLREFKRSRFVDFLVASSLRTSVQNALLAEWADVQSTLARWHRDDPTLSMLPARDSHDHDGSQSDA